MEPAPRSPLRVPPNHPVLVQVGRRGAAGTPDDERALLSLRRRADPDVHAAVAGRPRRRRSRRSARAKRPTQVPLASATITGEDPATPPCPSLGTVWRRLIPGNSGRGAISVSGARRDHARRLRRRRCPTRGRTRSTASTATAAARCEMIVRVRKGQPTVDPRRHATTCRRAPRDPARRARRRRSASSTAAPAASTRRPAAPAAGCPAACDRPTSSSARIAGPAALRPRPAATTAPCACRSRITRPRRVASAMPSCGSTARAASSTPGRVAPQLKEGERTVRLAAAAHVRARPLPARASPGLDRLGGARRRCAAACRGGCDEAARPAASSSSPPPPARSPPPSRRAWAACSAAAPASAPGASATASRPGEPTPTAVTFWSRLRTDRPRSGARLIVARDEDMRRVVATAVVPTGRGVDRTLKARVGGLKPDTEYFYVWQSRPTTSRRSAARGRGRRKDSAEPLRIAFSSCQHYQAGYFSAARRTPRPRTSTSTSSSATTSTSGPLAAPGRRAHGPHATPSTCAPTAASTALPRATPACASCTACTRRCTSGTTTRSRTTTATTCPPPAPLQRAAGYRAAFEWMPRIVYPRDRYRIYKRLAARRQRRPVPARHAPVPDGQRATAGRAASSATRRWRGCSPGSSRRRARWKIIAQQVPIAADPFGTGERTDAWDGFPEDRALLLGEIERAGIRERRLPHRRRARVRLQPARERLRARSGDGHRAPSAVEYVGGSVTSPGLVKPEAEVRAESRGSASTTAATTATRSSPLDPANLVTEYRRSDISHPAGGTSPFERFTQPSGASDVIRQSFAPPV